MRKLRLSARCLSDIAAHPHPSSVVSLRRWAAGGSTAAGGNGGTAAGGPVPPPGTAAGAKKPTGGSGSRPVGSLPFVDPGLPPPLPEGYIPVEMRTDDSISFVRDADGKRYITGIFEDTVLQIRQPTPKNFQNVTAERLDTTSVLGGQGLLSDTGYGFLDTTIKPGSIFATEDTPRALPGGPSSSPTSASSFVPAGSPPAASRVAAEPTFAARNVLLDTRQTPVAGDAEEALSNLGRPAPRMGGGNAAAEATDTVDPPRKPQTRAEVFREMEEFHRKMDYFQGTPRYGLLKKEFLERWGQHIMSHSGSSSSSNAADPSGDDDPSSSSSGAPKKKTGVFVSALEAQMTDATPPEDMDKSGKYTSRELAMGLESEPIDFARLSPKLQYGVELANAMPWVVKGAPGTQGIDKGYHFSPMQEIGKLKMGTIDLSAVSKDTTRMLNPEADKSLLRFLGLDPVQRHQVRHVFSDLDKGDSLAALHVIRTYPYGRHLLYLLFFGTVYAIYIFHWRWDVMYFYDEYLGIDFLQVPYLKSHLYRVMSLIFALTLCGWLTFLAIGMTRSYRIWRRRPIGPP